ncbi:hypothetical protein GCM10023115_22990 [Pontixanthobacter gangjinensis]
MIVPFRAMRELHNRSRGEIPEHTHSGVEDVAAWWTAYITATLIWTALALKLMVDVLTDIVFMTPCLDGIRPDRLCPAADGRRINHADKTGW